MPDTQEVPATNQPAPPPDTSTASNEFVTARATGGSVSVHGDRNKTTVRFKTSFAQDAEALEEADTTDETDVDDEANENEPQPDKAQTPVPNANPKRTTPPKRAQPPATQPAEQSQNAAETPHGDPNSEEDSGDQVNKDAESKPYAPTAPLLPQQNAPALAPAGLVETGDEPTNLGSDQGGTKSNEPAKLLNDQSQAQAATDISQSQQASARAQTRNQTKQQNTGATSNGAKSILSNPLFKRIIRFVPMAGKLLDSDEKKLEKQVEKLQRARSLFENAKHLAGLVDGIKNSATLVSEMTAILPILGTIIALLLSIPIIILYTFFGTYLRGTLSVQINKIVKAIDTELKPLLKQLQAQMKNKSRNPQQPS